MKNLLKANLSKQQWDSGIGQLPLEASFWLSLESKMKGFGVVALCDNTLRMQAKCSHKSHTNLETLHLWVQDRYSWNVQANTDKQVIKPLWPMFRLFCVATT